jgi:DNA-binding SARP family transcriptional activator/tetratricopeptide (TPR) repeat protein
LDGDVWLRVLGPVQLRGGDAWRTPPGPQLRLLLATFGLSAGQVVPVDDLIDVLWEEEPPPSARGSLQILVVRLRKTLAGLPGGTIGRFGDGYQLGAGRDAVDLHRFRSLVSSARANRHDHDAIAALDQALALWRGLALADVPGTGRVDAIRAGLAQEHLAAVQDRFGRLLAAGADRAAAAEIPLVLARHPLAEQLAGMLMIACYRCGRRADALQVFRDLRGRLAGELGVEPGRALQRLHQQILSGDPALVAPDDIAALLRNGAEAVSPARDAALDGPARRTLISEPAAGPGTGPRSPSQRARAADPPLALSPNESTRLAHAPSTAAPVVPRQLPTAPAHFAGRQRELELLTGWLDAGATAGETVILAIDGTAGAGKTALALHWAHRIQQRFGDGQLYVNLRGFDASPSPVAPGEAISGFLESLGVPAPRIPQRPDALTGLYRSLLAGKRMLIVLDNARDEAQVRPLLPGSAGCLVLVTSRTQLAGLVAGEGARPLPLGLLTDAEARQLLASRLGAARVAAEGDEVAELITLCAGLPLALTIAAARAAVHPAPLASVAAGLRGIQHRLDGLASGDRMADARAVFSWSYRLLNEPAARMFRLLGTHPGPDISVPAAASLTAVSEQLAGPALAELSRANLIFEHTPGRLLMHDLLRAYATELTGETERHGAIRRVLDHYLHTARSAVELAYPGARRLTAVLPAPGKPAERFAGPDQALAWLQAEHHVLLAAIAAALAGGHDTHAAQLPVVLTEYLSRRGHYADCAQAHRAAVTAAARLGDRAAQARAHRFLADALIQLGSWEDARAHLQDGLRLCRLLGDHEGQAACHFGAARTFELQGDHGQALHQARRALRMYRAAGDAAGQAAALNGVGWFTAMLGNNQRAFGYCRKALEMHRASGNRLGEAATLDSLGYCSHQAGHHQQAISFYQQALRVSAAVGDRYCRAQVLIRLGETHRAHGDNESSREHWQQALSILEGLQHPGAGPVRARLRDLVLPG